MKPTVGIVAPLRETAGVDVRIETQYLTDWPRGPLGYLARNRYDREFGTCDRRNRNTVDIKIDIGRIWYRANRDAHLGRRQIVETFLMELIDTVVHEYAHAFQPKRVKEARKEAEAENFAMYGRRTRLE